MGMSVEKMLAIKESIRVGSFCKEWWKQLSKVVKQSKLTDFEKILVFTKIACGLLIECESAIKIDDDVQYICENISDTLNQYIIPMKKGDKMDG